MFETYYHRLYLAIYCTLPADQQIKLNLAIRVIDNSYPLQAWKEKTLALLQEAEKLVSEVN